MKNQDGLIALITVVIVAAFIVVAGFSMALMNSDEMLSSYSAQESSKVVANVDACADNVLSRIRNDNTTSGNVNISLGNVSCVAIVSGSGNTRQIAVRATTTDAFSRDIVYSVNINVNINTNPFTVLEYKDILK